jgi:hypothetical protein
MALTMKFKREYSEKFDQSIYAFPKGSDVSIRLPLIKTLNDFLEQNGDSPVEGRFKSMMGPLLKYLKEPQNYVSDLNDYPEFIELLKTRIRLAIAYLTAMSDVEFEQFIDEKLAQTEPVIDNVKRDPVIKTPQQPYTEALDDLSLTLKDPRYAQNLRDAGKKILFATQVQVLHAKSINSGHAQMLITTNALIKNPNPRNATACLTVLNKLDDESRDYVAGAVYLLVGLVMLAALTTIIAMSWGAFAPLGIAAFSVAAQILITELGGILGTGAALIPLSQGVRKIEGDPEIHAAKQSFFTIEKIIKEPPHDDAPLVPEV